jgi:small subunit ribosomal protein S4e
MDVVEVPDATEVYRILPLKGKGLTPVKITKDEAKFKLCRIERKTTLRGGRIQLNLHDSRNLVVPIGDAASRAEAQYRVRDTLRLSIPSQKVLGHIKFAEGSYALVTSGRNIGLHGKITKIEPGTATRPPAVAIQDQTGNTIRTVADYVFAVGDDKPSIRLEGVR